MFMLSPIPDMKVGEGERTTEKSRKKTIGILLCVLCIFFGACSEITMTNWISSFMETEFHIDKAVGDIIGMAGFAVLLAGTRIAYARWGKNIWKTLLIGMIGAAVCYLVAGFSPYAVPAFIACILTGICTAMLWPGTLIYMEEKMPNLGVAAYALMAAGGDFGGAAAPQLMGAVIDWTNNFQAGMLVSAIFPILGIVVLLIMKKFFKEEKNLQPVVK
jgi:MFS family permease